MTPDIQKLRNLAASLLDLSEQPQDVAGAQGEIREAAIALPALLDRLEAMERALRQIDGQCGNIVFNLTQATPAWEDAPKERRDEFVRTAETFQTIARKAILATQPDGGGE